MRHKYEMARYTATPEYRQALQELIKFEIQALVSYHQNPKSLDTQNCCNQAKIVTKNLDPDQTAHGERGGSVVECRTPEREVRGSRPTVSVLCP